MPVLDDPLGCQVQHPPQGIVIGEGGLVLGDLPELPVQAFDNICRVYDFPNLRRIFKEGVQNLPVVLPALDAGRIRLPPGVAEDTQILLRFVLRYGGVYLLQVRYNPLDIFVADIFGRADTPLQTALWIHRLNGLHHAAQAVGAEQINIQNAPAFEVIQHIQPKFAALVLADPDTQNAFSAVHGDAQNHISRHGHIVVILLDLVVGGIHEDKRGNAFQRTVLLSVYLQHNFLGNFADQF